MKGKITPDDLKPNIFIIVEEWLDEALAPAPDGDDRPYWMRNPRERKPTGDPIKVLSVALPFITVELCGNGQRGCLDTRQINIQQVGIDYVRSLVPSYGKKKRDLTDEEKRAQETRKREVFKGGAWQTITEPKS